MEIASHKQLLSYPGLRASTRSITTSMKKGEKTKDLETRYATRLHKER